MVLTKDRESLLAAALASIQAQTFFDYEVILVDDGSRDATADVIERFQKKGLRIIPIRHDSSVGKTSSRQEVLLRAAGSYVAILDDDDEWLDTTKLGQQVAYLDNHPEVVLTGTGIIGTSSRSGERRQMFQPAGDRAIRRTMLIKNNFFTSSVMFRTEAALRAGGFMAGGADEAEDYSLWLRLGTEGQMSNILDTTVQYRLPDYGPARTLRIYQEQLRLVSVFGKFYPLYHTARLMLKLRIAKLKLSL